VIAVVGDRKNEMRGGLVVGPSFSLCGVSALQHLANITDPTADAAC
jgi:hypothetical protein